MGRNYIIRDDSTFICLDCGILFMPKFMISEVDVRGILEKQEFEKTAYICECGKDCINALGLHSHKKGSKCPKK